MKTFKVTAVGDVLYFSAPSQDDAKRQLHAMCGAIPTNLLEWKELPELPAGDEFAPDLR